MLIVAVVLNQPNFILVLLFPDSFLVAFSLTAFLGITERHDYNELVILNNDLFLFHQSL